MTGWSAHFREQFGEERWSSLVKALKQPVQHVCIPSPDLPLTQKMRLTPHSSIPHVFIDAPEDTGYFLDPASVVCALVLDAQAGHAVLDACAAPGGKSVAISRCLVENSTLVCNEISKSRFARLKNTLKEYCGTRISWRATNFDLSGNTVPSALIGNYDRVLVDAPCSSDRHTLGKDWSIKLVKENSERQLKILGNGASLVKPGGLVVYATCALATKENDEVISGFLKKHGNFFQVDKSWYADAHRWLPGGEETAHGIFFNADTCAGAGPLYVARLRRLAGGIVTIR